MRGQVEIESLYRRPEPIRASRPRVAKAKKKAEPPTYFRMLRRGTFYARESTPNQYVKPDHEIYYYTLQVVWSGDVKLDYRDFILDNADLSNFIANMKLQGSGEMMMKSIMEQVNVRLRELGIPPLACKITVRGQAEEARNEAYLEYTQAKPQHMALLQ